MGKAYRYQKKWLKQLLYSEEIQTLAESLDSNKLPNQNQLKSRMRFPVMTPMLNEDSTFMHLVTTPMDAPQLVLISTHLVRPMVGQMIKKDMLVILVKLVLRIQKPLDTPVLDQLVVLLDCQSKCSV